MSTFFPSIDSNPVLKCIWLAAHILSVKSVDIWSDAMDDIATASDWQGNVNPQQRVGQYCVDGIKECWSICNGYIYRTASTVEYTDVELTFDVDPYSMVDDTEKCVFSYSIDNTQNWVSFYEINGADAHIQAEQVVLNAETWNQLNVAIKIEALDGFFDCCYLSDVALSGTPTPTTTANPTNIQTLMPTSPSNNPSQIPSYSPSSSTQNPSSSPSNYPTKNPTQIPTHNPIVRSYTEINGTFYDDFRLITDLDSFIYGWSMRTPLITNGLNKYYGPWHETNGIQDYYIYRHFTCAYDADIIVKFTEIHINTAGTDWITVTYFDTTAPNYLANVFTYPIATDIALQNMYANKWYESDVDYRAYNIQTNQLFVVEFNVHVTGGSDYIGLYDISIECYPITQPTNIPTKYPTYTPSFNPSNIPTYTPSFTPSFTPSNNPTITPTNNPTNNPTHIADTHSINAYGNTINPTLTPTNNAKVDTQSDIKTEDKTANANNIGVDYLVGGFVGGIICGIMLIVLCIYMILTRRKISRLKKSIQATIPTTPTNASNEGVVGQQTDVSPTNISVSSMFGESHTNTMNANNTTGINEMNKNYPLPTISIMGVQNGNSNGNVYLQNSFNSNFMNSPQQQLQFGTAVSQPPPAQFYPAQFYGNNVNNNNYYPQMVLGNNSNVAAMRMFSEMQSMPITNTQLIKIDSNGPSDTDTDIDTHDADSVSQKTESKHSLNIVNNGSILNDILYETDHEEQHSSPTPNDMAQITPNGDNANMESESNTEDETNDELYAIGSNNKVTAGYTSQ